MQKNILATDTRVDELTLVDLDDLRAFGGEAAAASAEAAAVPPPKTGVCPRW